MAGDGKDLVFVEVRTRRREEFGAPEESLSAAKVRRLLATCQDYLQRRVEVDPGWRIDLVCVCLGRWWGPPHFRHIRHAIEL